MATQLRRRSSGSCWPCKKADFLPEESFKSWSNYAAALRQTPARFMDRLTAQSLDDMELNAVKGQSHHEMKKNLTWWDLMWFGIAAGIFVLTSQEANESAGPAVILSFAVSWVSSMLSVFCYTEFGVEIPVAGGSFAYLRVELGDFMAFVAAGNILLEYVIGGAAVARSWTSYFATLCNHHPNDFRVTVPHPSPDYSHLDPIAVVITAVVGVFAIKSTKGSSRFNYIASILHIFILLFIIVTGLTKADLKNHSFSSSS